jgi:hypothetical protein
VFCFAFKVFVFSCCLFSLLSSLCIFLVCLFCLIWSYLFFAAKSILEIARSAMSNVSDFACEASFQVLELIRKNKSEEVEAFNDSLLLEWSTSLINGIQFNDARIDSLRCLAAAEKVCIISSHVNFVFQMLILFFLLYKL